MSARLPPYVVSASQAPGGNRASIESSPVDGVRRSSTTMSSEPMSSRKRPSYPAGGNSPPGKRRRSGEYDRYAASGSPTRPFSPPPSRHNSITGIDVLIPTGPAPKPPHTKDGRRIDPYRSSWDTDTRRESLDRRASNGVRLPNHAGASALLQTNSPRSLLHGDTGTPGSGASTPQHGAPSAPSMLATTPSSATRLAGAELPPIQTIASIVNMANAEHYKSRLDDHEKYESSRSGTVSSLRSIQARKRAMVMKEQEIQKQKVGDSVLQTCQAVNVEKSGAEALTPEDRALLNQMRAETKGLQIEVGGLKKEREKMLSRLNELDKLNSSHEEMQTLSKRLTPLEELPQQLKDLDTLPQLVEKLQTTLDELSQWRQSYPEPFTMEQVRRTVTAQTEPTLCAIKADLAAQREQATGDNSPDVRMLLQFKEQIEKANWPNQFRVAKERIEEVAKLEGKPSFDTKELERELKEIKGVTKKEMNRLETKVDDEIDRIEQKIVNQVERVERKADKGIEQLEKRVDVKVKQFKEQADEKIAKDLRILEHGLLTVNGPLKPEHERTGKTVLGRIQELESGYKELQLVHENPDKLANDLEETKTTFAGFRKATDAKERKMTTNMSQLGSRMHDLEKSLSSVENARLNMNTRISTVEQSLPLITNTIPLVNSAHERIASMETRFEAVSSEAVSSRINTIDSNKGGLLEERVTALEGEVSLAHRDIGAINDGLQEAEQVIHNLGNKVTTVEDDIARTIDTKLQQLRSDLGTELRSLKDQTPASFSSAERQQLQALVQDSQVWNRTLNNKATEWQQTFTSLSNQVEIIQASYVSLEDRYENISTDAIHQRMVHWFTENYPTAHNMVGLAQSVQQELSSFRNLAKNLHWLLQDKDQLMQLSRVAQELTDMAQTWKSQHFMFIVENSATMVQLVLHSEALLHLVQGVPGLAELPQIMPKLDAISKTATDALRKSDETAALGLEYEAQQKAFWKDVKQQRQSIDDLNIKVKSTHEELKESISELTTRADTVDTTISTHDKRMDKLNRSTTTLDQEVVAVKGAVSSLEGTLNLEQIAEFCAETPQLVLAIFELQKIVSEVNASVNGGFPHQFTFNIEKMQENLRKKATAAKGNKTT